MADGTDPDALTLTLASSTGEAVPLSAGVAVAGEPWFIGAELDDAPILEIYGAMLPSRRGDVLGAFFLSDDLRALPEERHGWGFSPERLEVGLAGVAAVPESVFPQGIPGRLSNAFEDAIAGTSTVQVPAVWRSGFGYRVAFNFGDDARTIEATELPRRSAAVLP